MVPVVLDRREKLEVCMVNGNEYLFTNLRIKRDALPEGVVAYDVRDNCDGEWCQIQRFVMVNHWGAIIGTDPLPMEEEGCYYPEGDDGCFTGEVMSLAEFLKEKEAQQ